MKNPCKFCLVKPACSEDCNDYKKFIDYCSTKVGILSIVFGLIITTFIFYLNGVFSGNPDNESLTIIWFLSTIISIYINIRIGLQLNNCLIVLAAPLVISALTSTYFLVEIQKRSMRKRY